MTDNGYHSGAVLVQLYSRAAAERAAKWEGKVGQRQAVHANRRGVQGNTAKAYCDGVESWSNAVSSSGRLIHVAGFNLSLIIRKLLGAGTPREWANRPECCFCSWLGLFTRRQEHNRRCRSMTLRSRTTPAETTFVAARPRTCRGFGNYTTDC